MSHPEQLAFLELVALANPELLTEGQVLEIGSYDVNGSMRRIFSAAKHYVGVDLVEGPGVDIVGFGHEVDFPEGSCDMVVSGECFEHDPHWEQTFLHMIDLTRPGGVVAFTCASTGRPEHGTTRTKATDSPGTQSEGIDYYRNLAESDVAGRIPLAKYFSAWQFHAMRTSMDLYFAGVRRGYAAPHPQGSLPDPSSVAKIAELMPPSHRAARLPLRVAARVLSDRKYQDFAVAYWTRLDRLFGSMAAR